MDRMTASEIRQLVQANGAPCVSLLLPTHRSGPQNEQDPIRLKNLLRQAEKRLADRGLRSADAANLLAPAQALLGDPTFWQHQADGLAVYLDAGGMRHYRTTLPLRENVMVSDRFYVLPLLPLVVEDARFFLLALSAKRVRFFEGSRHEIRQREVPEMPQSLDDLARYIETEKHLQWHTEAPRIGGPGSGDRAAMFHGQGGGSEAQSEHKLRLLEYSRWIDRALRSVLREESAPLLLACDKSLMPIYREANSYAQLSERGVPGNPDELSPAQLHEQAWRVIQTQLDEQRRRAIERYRQAAAGGQGSDRLETIVAAALDGRIDTLLAASGAEQWGQFDPQERRVVLGSSNGAGSVELLNFAAGQTFLSRGSVLLLPSQEMPTPNAAAAVFRW